MQYRQGEILNEKRPSPKTRRCNMDDRVAGTKPIRYWTTHAETSAASWSHMLQLDEHKFSLIPDPVSPDYLIVSEHLYTSRRARRWFKRMNDGRRVTIFFAGEAIFPDMNLFDYAVSFDRGLSLDDRVCRMPTLNLFHVTGQPSAPRAHAAEVLRGKTGFCNFVYANPRAHPMRDRIFHKLSEYKRVDSLGPHLNNVGTSGSRASADWRREALEMKRPYKFSIASENAVYNGYVTEKIMSSFQALTVPIYWGDPSIAAEFNPRAFVNANDYADLDDILHAVREIDQDDDRWIRMVSEPILTDDQWSRCRADHERYAAFTERIFGQELSAAKRVPQGYWPGLYRGWFEHAAARETSPWERLANQTPGRALAKGLEWLRRRRGIPEQTAKPTVDDPGGVA